MSHCIHLLETGKNKGKPCNAKTWHSNYCSKHLEKGQRWEREFFQHEKEELEFTEKHGMTREEKAKLDQEEADREFKEKHGMTREEKAKLDQEEADREFKEKHGMTREEKAQIDWDEMCKRVEADRTRREKEQQEKKEAKIKEVREQLRTDFPKYLRDLLETMSESLNCSVEEYVSYMEDEITYDNGVLTLLDGRRVKLAFVEAPNDSNGKEP